MRLLLAEDEIELANALAAILTHSGYETDTANDGEEALKRLSECTYDALVLDVMMPKLDGLEVLRRMRAAKNATPVIILTAKSELDDKVEGLDAGADDYLTKPFAAKELLARIRAVTRRERAEAPARTLALGNTELGLDTYRLRGPLGELVLTNKEFKIMEALLRSRDRILPQSEILEKIWDGEETDPGVLWVYISYIRKKLDKIGSDAIIKAHRNAGYSLVNDN
jgi:DNA-binding response OmpR family regulator